MFGMERTCSARFWYLQMQRRQALQEQSWHEDMLRYLWETIAQRAQRPCWGHRGGMECKKITAPPSLAVCWKAKGRIPSESCGDLSRRREQIAAIFTTPNSSFHEKQMIIWVRVFRTHIQRAEYKGQFEQPTSMMSLICSQVKQMFTEGQHWDTLVSKTSFWSCLCQVCSLGWGRKTAIRWLPKSIWNYNCDKCHKGEGLWPTVGYLLLPDLQT